jgi:cardiolipin synthase A/B
MSEMTRPDDHSLLDEGARHLRRQVTALVALVAIPVAIVGVFSTWTTDGPVTLNGTEGPHDGWLVVIVAALALAWTRSMARDSWFGVAGVLAAGIVMAWTAVDDWRESRAVFDASASYGLIVVVAASVALAAAAVVQGAELFRGRNSKTGTPRRRWRTALGILALVAAALFVFVYRQVLLATEQDNWPPPADAVTSADAAAATEAFAARDGIGPHDAAFDFAWSTAATIEPLVEGANFFPRIFADIEAARSSVHILMFGWREGDVGQDMAALLERKLAEGVEVRVIVDRFGSRPYEQAREMYTGLSAAGAQIVVNDEFPLDRDGLFPDQHVDRQDEVGRADHRKLYVIDGRIAWTGGAGIEDHFADGGFHDVMVRVTGDVVRQAQAAFLTSFHGHDGPLPEDLSRYFPDPAEAGATPIALVQVIPGGFVAATQAVREQIDGAEERLDLMNPYLTDRDMVDRIVAAARRGVKVRVVVSETGNNPPATAALEHHYGELIDAGAELWEVPGTVVHAKVVVADDVVSFGTLNLDGWALYRDAEIAMVARSAEAATLFEERLFEPDIARSKPGEPRTGTGERLEGWVWDKLGYFL